MLVNKLRGIYATITIAVGLAVIVFFIKFFHKKDNARLARTWCRLFFPFNRFEIEVMGAFDESADILMLNHQSVADIIFLESLHPRNICWIAKKQLGEIPFYGYALRGPEMILIDREDKSSLIYLLKEAKIKLAQNRPLVIFPEGTRCKDESKFLPFKSGAKLITEKFNLKVQPIVLVNSAKIYSTSPFQSCAKKAKVIALEAFTPEKGSDWYESIQVQMQEVYKKHYKELNP
ncbi:1-acyl-sn-glycerol-3-phosphate acyltransferase [Helicobacter cholecystus]|uniref:1-acyl-sn-glycerol-3-phosphate acyltransferase n=1 Tax=Helicobacter cholecystus TaxID=45498 RepID=A0A3D8IUE5_9HELI|nr:lysophospholipid acyltransferase family protein [Helicobacter cholecystus]RDU68630.1 1-acyl-sn-glycerol-3-phosphate acyltransferase [Helicobacter cholecystus]VEJ24422.1 1-acyl-SN-glycerol-3-phosphate acyltransferase [Helicobacter cholecystus]